MATIIGTTGNNTLNGTASSDTIIGQAGTDRLFGNNGNDLLNGGLGNDLVNGGAGIDTADYNYIRIGTTTYIGATAGVTVNLNLTSAQNTRGAGIDTLVGIENLNGTNFNDTLTGNSANNTLAGLVGNDILTGNGGNDILMGWSGNDTLNGGTGNDILNGGSGNDLLNGGAGIDTASYATATAGVTVNIGLDTDRQAQNTGGAGIDTLLNIENLTGSNFDDGLSAVYPLTDNGTLNGGAGNDSLFTDHASGFTLNGEAGNDKLAAVESFNVTLNGGSGNDHLAAYDGFATTLNGGDGNDLLEESDIGAGTLNGGAGADTLYCGAGGGSICDYNAVSDTPVGAGRDKINGFNGDFHQIDLTTIDAIPGGADNAFTYIGSAAFTAAGQLRYNTTTGILSGSIDGDTAAEFEIQFVGAPALTVGGAGSDILL